MQSDWDVRVQPLIGRIKTEYTAEIKLKELQDESVSRRNDAFLRAKKGGSTWYYKNTANKATEALECGCMQAHLTVNVLCSNLGKKSGRFCS